MKSTSELLALAKARNGDCSDYRLSKLLGIRPSAIAHYNAGRSIPANPIAARLAELCGLDPAAVICWVNIERATSPEDRETWNFMLSRVQHHEGERLAA